MFFLFLCFQTFLTTAYSRLPNVQYVYVCQSQRQSCETVSRLGVHQISSVDKPHQARAGNHWKANCDQKLSDVPLKDAISLILYCFTPSGFEISHDLFLTKSDSCQGFFPLSCHERRDSLCSSGRGRGQRSSQIFPFTSFGSRQIITIET